jgi:hypothetical protein
MIDVLPLGWAIYKVLSPRPIMYTFSPTGLQHFVWADQFDRKYGRRESNKRSVITQCISLRLDERQRESAQLAQHFASQTTPDLSINTDTLGRIVLHHAICTPDHSFETRDMRLFFEQYTNDRNDAERWLDGDDAECWFSGQLANFAERRISSPFVSARK